LSRATQTGLLKTRVFNMIEFFAQTRKSADFIIGTSGALPKLAK
jgi:hypothetical protein